jgi:hypothetical protein
MSENIDLLLKATLFQAIYETETEKGPVAGLSNPWANAPVVKTAVDDGGDVPEVVGQLFAKAERNVGQVPEVWEEPFVPTSFEERSQLRFQKMCTVIASVFGDHVEERAEAIEIAKRALADARVEAEVIAAA